MKFAKDVMVREASRAALSPAKIGKAAGPIARTCEDDAMTIDGALIGCGFFAQNHLEAWRDLAGRDPGARLVAVCDIDAAKAKAAAAKFGVPRWYADAGEMFANESLAFVDIATTMASHRPLAELAARHGVPMIVQKPFAPTFEDCAAIVAAAQAAGVPLMVHENFRFQTPMMKAKAVVASGEIGEPVWGRFNFRTSFDVYANQPYLKQEKQLVILDLGIHLLDIARVFMGEVERIACETQRINAAIAAEDMATMLLRHASGAVSVVDCSYASRQIPDPFPQTLIHIDGRKGSLKVDRDFAMEVSAGGAARHEHMGSPLLSWTSQPWHAAQESVVDTQAHFIDCLVRGREPATSGADNLKTYALVMAAYAAAQSHRSETPRA